MIIQTTNQSDLETLARQALPASATEQDVTATMTAIRSANPALNLDTIQPGMTIVVPATSTTVANATAVTNTRFAELESQVAAAITELTPLAQQSESEAFATVTEQWIAQVGNLAPPAG
jgi:hypothetical protein